MKPRVVVWCAVSTGRQAENDKDSLPNQKREAFALADQQGWQIVDVLSFPGISRRFYNFFEFADNALAEGIEAPRRMLQHWRDKTFDIFVCRDGSRFGREQSIFAEVVARTIHMGARIYTMHDSGWIDASNYRMYSAMGGYQAAGEVDKIQHGRKIGIAKRASLGLPIGSKPLMTHKIIRDPNNGKALHAVLDPDHVLLWGDLAKALLAGVPYYKLAASMAALGHVRKNNTPYVPGYFWKLLHHPQFWGHIAQDFTWRHANRNYLDLWALDEEHASRFPPTTPLIIHRDVLDPVYTGTLAAEVKAEMVRRRTSIRGKATFHSHRFTGLLMCDECKCTFVYTGGRRYMRCRMHASMKKGETTCTNSKHIHEKAVQAYFERILEIAVELNSLEVIYQIKGKSADTIGNEIAVLENDLAKTQAEISNLLYLSADIDPQLLPDLKSRLNTQSAYRTETQKRITVLKARDQSSSRAVAEGEFEDIKTMGPEKFWALSDTMINIRLHRLLGVSRYTVLDGKIKAFDMMPTHRRRRPRAM